MTTVERDEVEGVEVAPPRPTPPPRPPRRRRATILMAVVAIVFFFGPGVAYLGGARAKEIENRRLTSFPSISQGWSALPQLGRWAVDHLPGRQQAVDANDAVTRHVFGEYPNYGTHRHRPGPVPVRLVRQERLAVLRRRHREQVQSVARHRPDDGPHAEAGQRRDEVRAALPARRGAGQEHVVSAGASGQLPGQGVLDGLEPEVLDDPARDSRAEPGRSARTARGSTAAHRPADVAPARFPFQPARRVDLRADARRLPRLAARPGHHGQSRGIRRRAGRSQRPDRPHDHRPRPGLSGRARRRHAATWQPAGVALHPDPRGQQDDVRAPLPGPDDHPG